MAPRRSLISASPPEAVLLALRQAPQCLQQRAAVADHIDIAPCRARDREHLVDRQIRVAAAVALVAGLPLERDRGLELVILEQGGRRVVRAGMNAKDELGHRAGVEAFSGEADV